MISDRHYECLDCRAYIRRHCPQNSSGQAKATYQKQLAEDDEAYETHTTTALQEQEAKKAGLGRRAGPVKRTKVGDESIEDEAPMQKLLKTQGRALEVRECIGVLWPVDAFSEDVGRGAKKSDICTMNLSGQIHSGVMRPRSFGIPDGGKEIFSTDAATMSSVATLHSSEDAVAEGETEAVTKFAMNKMKMRKTSVADEKNAKDVVLKMRAGDGGKKKKDVDALDSIWDGPTVTYTKEKAEKEDKDNQGDDASVSGAPPLARPASKRTSGGGVAPPRLLTSFARSPGSRLPARPPQASESRRLAPQSKCSCSASKP